MHPSYLHLAHLPVQSGTLGFTISFLQPTGPHLSGVIAFTGGKKATEGKPIEADK